MTRFGLVGNGTISARHKKAIEHVGGELVWIADPCLDSIEGETALFVKHEPSDAMYERVQCVVICSPTKFHREQIKAALNKNKQVICEKPVGLPWEPLIDDARINIVLQLRWIKGLPKKADLVRAVMVRDEEFYKTWKGDPKQAGGNIYEFYIHYADLSILLGADFEGSVLPEGQQVREILWKDDQGKESKLDIMAIDMQDLYNRMYEDILQGKGVRPKDIFYLTWVLNHASVKYGYRYAGVNGKIFIRKELL